MSFFLLLFFNCNLLLYLEKLFVGLFKILSGSSSSLFSLHVSKFFSFELLLDLFLDELALELLFLHFLDVVELKILELILNILSVFHFLMVFFFQFFSESHVVFCHFLFFKLFPLQIYFLIKLILSLLGDHLLLLLCNNIAHQHLAMKSLDHVGIVVEHLIGFVKLSLSIALLEGLFFGIDFPSPDLVVFQFFDAFVFFTLPLGVDSVWPLGDSCQRNDSFIFSLTLSHGHVILFLIGLRAHALNSFQLVVRKDSCVFGNQSLVFLFEICKACIGSSSGG